MTEVSREFVGLPSPLAGRAGAGGHPCQGIYYTATGTRPRTAVIATHYNVDFSEHYLAPYLAQRGYGFLGWNTRFRGNEAFFLLDHALAEIGVGVAWLRERAGVEQVVLLGNSGGGSLMAAYQSQAGEPNVTASGATAADAIADLPAGDFYIALAAHPGRPEVLTAWLDPSVTDEADPLSVDPELDPYGEANPPPFDEEFQCRYRAAQRARNQRITDWAAAQLDALRGTRAGDRLFHTYRVWADLRMIDPTIEPSERRPRHCYLGDPQQANYGVYGIGSQSTLRTWLSMWSLETSQCRGAPHLARITLPSLVVQATADAGVYDSDARSIHDALGATDRRLERLSGNHYFTEPSGARGQVADLIAGWLAERGA
ncbi:MAG: alpha/beta hydrolase [Pseudonocardiaceae bacterium]|nr:alpha/beta hydrolase [Pseudonocardiaceae bacterium]